MLSDAQTTALQLIFLAVSVLAFGWIVAKQEATERKRTNRNTFRDQLGLSFAALVIVGSGFAIVLYADEPWMPSGVMRWVLVAIPLVAALVIHFYRQRKSSATLKRFGKQGWKDNHDA